MTSSLAVNAPGTNLAYDTAALILTVANLKTSQNFLIDKYFGNIVMSDNEFVAIDVDVGKRRMAPFVSPMVEGKLVEQRRFQTNIFKPAYIKDKRAPDLRKPIRRMIGERIGGEMVGAEREAANIAAEMADQIDIINRRLEWMAAQVLNNGSLVVKGDGFPDVTLDFGRHSALTVALTGGAQWTNANIVAGTASPSTNIEAWQRSILKISGAQVTDIIFSTTAWEGFIADPLLKGAEFYPQLASFGNAINVGPQIVKGAVFKGRWGQYNLWIYNDWFVDQGTEGASGGTLDKEYPMIPDGNLILTGPDMMGTRAFGVILDPDFNYQAMPYAPKTWTEKDPGQRFIMVQSSPIIIPARVNACLGASVAPAQYT